MIGLLVLFLICAFKSGSDRFYLKKAVGMKSDGRDVIYYVRARNALRLVGFYLCFYALKLVVLRFSFAPFIALLFVLNALLYGDSTSAMLFVVLLFMCGVLFIFGTVFFIRLNSFFFLARYCFASGNFRSFRRLFSFSFSCMDGNRKNVFEKKLTFVPWFFSCVFLLPISFVRSYYNQSMADLAADLIQKHLQKP